MEQKIWNFLISNGLNAYGAAGLMGNLYAESGLNPKNLEDLCEKRLRENGKNYTDETYTKAIDNGTISRAEFLNPLPGKQYGYGLAQWTSPGRKAGLYDLAKSKKASIADIEVQLEWLLTELKNAYQSVYNTLKTASSVKEASDIVLLKFECPADTGSAMKNIRASYGQNYYDKYAIPAVTHGGPDKMTLNKAKEYTTKLLKHYPFVYCPTLAQFTSNKTPHVGDIVLFYRNGTFAHTGLVYKVNNSIYYTIEGNTSGASGVVPNGGGVCKKQYSTSSVPGTKFFRPDYSILVNDGIYKSVDEVINKIIQTAEQEVGYLEKASNSNLDSKTNNAGSNNYTKYWRDIYPAYQAQAWCACFVTWVIQKTIEGAQGGSIDSMAGPVENKNNKYEGTGIGYAIAKTGMNIRNQGSTNGLIISTIPTGTRVEVLEILDNGWYKIVWTAAVEGYAYVSNSTKTYFSYSPKVKNEPVPQIKTESATNFDKSIAGTYSSTASSLNVRIGAGTDNSKKILVAIPKGTKVSNYGYYSLDKNVKWLYIQFSYQGKTYTGFASSKYLKKV